MSALIVVLVAQAEMFDPGKVRAFADHLYGQEDYGAALNEYRRYTFLADSAEAQAHDRIIDCLTHLERYGEAITEAEKINDANRRHYIKGMIYFLAGAMDSSRAYLEGVDVPYRNRTDARRMIGLGYAYEYRFSDAAGYIAMPQYAPSRKKPVLGALFSVFPGGGHAYAGRWGDGIYSLFVIGTGTLLSYYYHEREETVKFGFTLGTTLLLYAGNIYGGINAVRNYNRSANEDYLEQIMQMNRPRE
ncbi:hypothetical protein IBX73_10940 [candidate division WOR-3 bacterium]|nr:hypothetical protein [candidate division WOR-3 bacterium]